MSDHYGAATDLLGRSTEENTDVLAGTGYAILALVAEVRALRETIAAGQPQALTVPGTVETTAAPGSDPEPCWCDRPGLIDCERIDRIRGIVSGLTKPSLGCCDQDDALEVAAHITGRLLGGISDLTADEADAVIGLLSALAQTSGGEAIVEQWCDAHWEQTCDCGARATLPKPAPDVPADAIPVDASLIPGTTAWRNAHPAPSGDSGACVPEPQP